MIYAVIFAVAVCDFLLIFHLGLLAHVIKRGPEAYSNYDIVVQARAFYAATSFALSAAIIRAWEMGVFDG